MLYYKSGFIEFIKDDLGDLEKVAQLKLEVKQFYSEEKSGKEGFHYDPKRHFVSITKAVKVTSEELLKQSRATPPAKEYYIKNLPGSANT